MVDNMRTETVLDRDLFDRLPAGSTLVLRDVPWDDYEALLDAVGEAAGLRISYDRGTLQIMTLSAEHEKFVRLLDNLVSLLSVRRRIKVLSFGSFTMKRKIELRGAEPDACFYVQSANVIGGKSHIDLASDPPPDVVVEIDVHHESVSKLPIYAGLGVPEVWRYDGQTLTISRLEGERYSDAKESLALPMLTAAVLTDFLSLGREKDQYEVFLAFEKWLDEHQ